MSEKGMVHGNSTTEKNVPFKSVGGEENNGRGKIRSEVLRVSIEHRRTR